MKQDRPDPQSADFFDLLWWMFMAYILLSIGKHMIHSLWAQ